MSKIIFDDEQASTDLPEKGDMTGPDGSRYSNFHLWQQLQAEGAIFNEDLEPCDEAHASVNFLEATVWRDFDYSGRTHEWRLASVPNPWEINRPALVVTIYEQCYVHAGPEEGGWGWSPKTAVAAITIANPYQRESVDAALAAAELLCAIRYEQEGAFEPHGYQNRHDLSWFFNDEVVFGTDHSVGGVYYC